MKEIEDVVQKLYVSRLQDPARTAFDARLLHVTKGSEHCGCRGQSRTHRDVCDCHALSRKPFFLSFVKGYWRLLLSVLFVI